MELGALQQRVIALSNHDFSIDLKKMHLEIPYELLRLRPIAEEEMNQASADFASRDCSYLSFLSEKALGSYWFCYNIW